MKIIIKPCDFECTLAECPPGHFFYKGMLGFKSQYGQSEAFCDSGEMFWAGTKCHADRLAVKVIPLTYEIEQ